MSDEIPARYRLENETPFRRELCALLNSWCRENGSNTPDYLLAHFLNDCLDAFDAAVNERERWYGRTPLLVEDRTK